MTRNGHKMTNLKSCLFNFRSVFTWRLIERLSWHKNFEGPHSEAYQSDEMCIPKLEWAEHKDIKKNKFSFHGAFIMVEMEFFCEIKKVADMSQKNTVKKFHFLSFSLFAMFCIRPILHFFKSRKISLFYVPFYDLIQTW